MINSKKILIVSLLLITIFVVACTNDSVIVGENDMPQVCIQEYDPVCATADIECVKTPCPQQMTYGNSCMAESAGEEVLYVGECQVDELKACTREYNPQCGVDGVSYSNPCMAGDVEIAYPGTCNAKIQSACEDNNGTWLSDSNECEGLSKDLCDQLGGTFNECASACRNNPKAQMCTMQCVLVCQFN